MDYRMVKTMKGIAKYGKASLKTLPRSGCVNAVLEIDFKAPIEAIDIRQFFEYFDISLLVATGPWQVCPIGFVTIGAPKKIRLEESRKTRWSLLLKVAFDEDDIHQDRLGALIEHIDIECGEGEGEEVWNDFIIGFSFHKGGEEASPFLNPVGTVAVYNQEYCCGGYIKSDGDIVPSTVPQLKDLGKTLKDDLHTAIEANAEDVNRDVDMLVAAADFAFAEFEADDDPQDTAAYEEFSLDAATA